MLGDALIVHASDEGARIDLDATFRALPIDAIAIMCGPMRMLEAARRAWNDAGRAPADLRYETFGSSGLLPTAEFRVRLKNSDTELVVPQTSSMLDVLNEAGFEVMSDCQRGECGVCAVDVVAVDGEIDHRDVFFSDQQKRTTARSARACRARWVSSPSTRCTDPRRTVTAELKQKRMRRACAPFCDGIERGSHHRIAPAQTFPRTSRYSLARQRSPFTSPVARRTFSLALNSVIGSAGRDEPRSVAAIGLSDGWP